jgi:hypothetical protein
MTDRNREKTPSAGRPHSVAELRGFADLFCLWRLCARPACRRARACRGDARLCFSRQFHLLPQDVRRWLDELTEMQREGLPFDTAMQELDTTECGIALRDWYAAVSRSLGENGAMPAHWWAERW